MGKKIIFFCIIFIMLPLYAHNEQPCQPQNFYTIVNTQTMCTEEGYCSPLHGKQLSECLFSLKAEDQREEFAKLSPKKREAFLRTMNLRDYQRFTQAFNEEQWKLLLNKLTQKEQSTWPQTIQEQVAAAEKIDIDATTVSDRGYLATIGISIISYPVAIGILAYKAGYIIVHGDSPIRAHKKQEYFEHYLKEKFNIEQQ